MYKIIIYHNDLESIRNVCNNLFFKYRNLKIMGVAITEIEFFDMCNKIKPHIILTSQNLLSNPNINKFLSKIENKIILCKNKEKFRNSKHTLYISQQADYCSVQKDFDTFLLNVDEIHIHKKIHKLLERFGFDFKLTGTNYLFDAIIYSVIHKDEYLFENLEKNIYPYVAKKFNVSIGNVKWSIVRSINNMNSNFNNINSPKFPEKITCKSLITEVVNRIK